MKNKIALIAISILLIISYSPDVYAKRKKKGKSIKKSTQLYEASNKISKAEKGFFGTPMSEIDKKVQLKFKDRTTDYTGLDGGSGLGGGMQSKVGKSSEEIQVVDNTSQSSEKSNRTKPVRNIMDISQEEIDAYKMESTPINKESQNWTGMDAGYGPGAASTARFDSRYTEIASYYNLNPFAQPSKEELERMLLEYNIKKYGKYVGMLVGIFLIIFIIKNILKKQG
jgi:hypothetical protein